MVGSGEAAGLVAPRPVDCEDSVHVPLPNLDLPTELALCMIHFAYVFATFCFVCYLNMHPFIGFSTKSYRMNMCRHYSRILCSTFVLRLESLNFKKFVCLFVFVFVFVVAGKPRS